MAESAAAPETGSEISGSAIRVPSSTGVTELGQTTYPTAPGGASDGSSTAVGVGEENKEQPVSSAPADTAQRTANSDEGDQTGRAAIRRSIRNRP